MRFAAVAAIISLASLGGAAHAQEAPTNNNASTPGKGKGALARTIAKRAIQRTRRSIALGPFGTAGVAVSTDGSDPDFVVGGGIALMKFGIPPIASPESLERVVRRHVMREYARRAKALGRPPTADERKQLMRDVMREVTSELALEHTPSRFEKPSAAAMLEVDHLTSSGAWQVRLTLAKGIGPVYASTGIVAHHEADTTATVIPLEVSVPILFGKRERTKVIDVFLRVDLAAHKRDALPDRIVGGARFLLDVI